jgi:hypothetical protein
VDKGIDTVRTSALIAAASLLLPTVAGAQPLANVPRPLTDDEMAQARELVSQQLKDPESARFRWNPSVLDENIYCGFVNARNSFGGYVGYRVFFVNYFKTGVKARIAQTAFGRETSICRDEGYNVSPSHTSVIADVAAPPPPAAPGG